MKDDLALPDLCARVFTGLSRVTDTAKHGWRPEIMDRTLRGAILGNRRLDATILAEIIENQGIDRSSGQQPVGVFKGLRHVLDADPDQLIRRVGLVWHSDQIALLVLQGELKRHLGGIGPDDVRRALTMRRYSRAPHIRPEDLLSAVDQSGRRCLSAWLNNLAQPACRVFAILDSPLGAIYRDGCRSPEMAGVVSACLEQKEALA